MPDEPVARKTPKPDKSLALVQREVALVVVLCVVAVVTFLATQRLADWHHGTATAAAQAFFDKGQALIAEGRVDDGIAALRKAGGADRGNRAYTHGRVGGRRGGHEDEEAWQTLLRLRQEEPEHAEINYRLARLAARRGETDLAVRYYNHALYGVNPADDAVDRRAVLTELAELQLDLGDLDSAAGVLALLEREPISGPEDRLTLARLYERSGQLTRALDAYDEVLAEAPELADAHLGAADVALALGNLRVARDHLEDARNAGVETPDLARRLDVARLAVDSDPLAPRLSMTERVRRLRLGLTWANERLAACPHPAGEAAPITGELAAFRRQAPADLRDTDVLASGLDLVGRVADDVRARCGASGVEAEAWALVRRVHGASL